MGIRYEIRQSVETVKQRWLVPIASSEFERVITNDYQAMVAEHPDKYFELVKVVTEETCLAFTPFK
jgi:hypothetical protein